MEANKQQRVARDRSDLQVQLSEHIRMLIKHCRSYDLGEAAMAKPMASVLYQLLFSGQRPGSNVALLGELGTLDSMKFFGTAKKPRPTDLGVYGLTYLMQNFGRSGDGWELGVGHTPFLSPAIGSVLEVELLPFDTWWEEIVIVIPNDKMERGATFSRKQLVQSVTDTDGGRHTDTSLTPGYHKLTRGHGIGIGVNINGEMVYPQGVAQASIRQIAHEVLLSLMTGFPVQMEGNDVSDP